jgi:hypothetical protein
MRLEVLKNTLSEYVCLASPMPSGAGAPMGPGSPPPRTPIMTLADLLRDPEADRAER